MLGGAVCLDEGYAPVSCSGPHAYGPINHNLGTNQAAYAIDFPEFDRMLDQGLLSGYRDFYFDLRLGCDPATGARASQACRSRDLNGGFEQVFILPGYADPPFNVSAPGTLALMGAGLLGAAFRRRRA